MDAKRAAEVLRRGGTFEEVFTSTDIGAQALEALAWVERQKAQITAMPYGYVIERIVSCRWVQLGQGQTPLDAVLDAMEKEKANG